jgi:hypothetical protein
VKWRSDPANIWYFYPVAGSNCRLILFFPLDARELENRNTFFRAVFGDADRLVSCEKIVYGEVQLTHRYDSRGNDTLSHARTAMGDDEETEICSTRVARRLVDDQAGSSIFIRATSKPLKIAQR